MFLWPILSFIAGGVVGGVYAFLFYKANNTLFGEQTTERKRSLLTTGSFLLRYLLLFAAFFILFYLGHLNIYYGIAGFFVVYWGVLLFVLRRAKMRNHHEP